MAKTLKFEAVAYCGKFLIKEKKSGRYLCPDGRLTPFTDDGTVTYGTEEAAGLTVQMLNKNHMELIMNLAVGICCGMESKDNAPYCSLLDAAGLTYERKGQ